MGDGVTVNFLTLRYLTLFLCFGDFCWRNSFRRHFRITDALGKGGGGVYSLNILPRQSLRTLMHAEYFMFVWNIQFITPPKLCSFYSFFFFLCYFWWVNSLLHSYMLEHKDRQNTLILLQRPHLFRASKTYLESYGLCQGIPQSLTFLNPNKRSWTLNFKTLAAPGWLSL